MNIQNLIRRPGLGVLTLAATLISATAFGAVTSHQLAELRAYFGADRKYGEEELVREIAKLDEAFVQLSADLIFADQVVTKIRTAVPKKEGQQIKTNFKDVAKAFENNRKVMRALLSIEGVREGMGKNEVARIFARFPDIADSFDARNSTINEGAAGAAYIAAFGALPQRGSQELERLRGMTLGQVEEEIKRWKAYQAQNGDAPRPGTPEYQSLCELTMREIQAGVTVPAGKTKKK